MVEYVKNMSTQEDQSAAQSMGPSLLGENASMSKESRDRLTAPTNIFRGGVKVTQLLAVWWVKSMY